MPVGIPVGLGVLVVVDTTKELVPVADCASATEIPFHPMGKAGESNSNWRSILGQENRTAGATVYITPSRTYVCSTFVFLGYMDISEK